MRTNGLLGLLLAVVAPAAAADDPLGPLTSAVWWNDPATGEGCQEWTFARKDAGRTLERRQVERGDGWSRDARVIYTLTTDAGRPLLYAPEWRYTWIQAPGPDAREVPAELGAASWVLDFCLLEQDARRLVWTGVACDRVTEQTPRRIWYRAKADCV